MIKTKNYLDPYFRFKLFSSSKFNATKFATDKENILRHYNALGYRDASIIADTQYYNAKGNMNIEKLEEVIKRHGASNIPFIRMEASTNLIGGQPFSVQNLRDVRALADKYGIRIVLDCSLLGENAFLVLKREEEFKKSDMKTVLIR